MLKKFTQNMKQKRGKKYCSERKHHHVIGLRTLFIYDDDDDVGILADRLWRCTATLYRHQPHIADSVDRRGLGHWPVPAKSSPLPDLEP